MRKLLPALLILFLIGSLYSFLPFSSSRITDIRFQDFTFFIYGLLFIPIGIGGVIGGLLVGPLTKKRGLGKSYVLGLLFLLFSLFFSALLAITVFEMTLNLVLFFAALFLWGLANGFLFPVSMALIASHASLHLPAAFTACFAVLSLGDVAASFLLHIPLAYIVIASLLVIFLLFFDPSFPIPEETVSLAKPLWKVACALFCVGLFVTLILNWITLDFIGNKGFTQKEARHVLMAFLITSIASRLFFGALLRKVSFRLLYWLIPLLLVITSWIPILTQSVVSTTIAYSIVGFFFAPLLPFPYAWAATHFSSHPLVIGKLVASFFAGFGLGAYLFGALPHLAWFIPLLALIPLLILFFNALTLKRQLT